MKRITGGLALVLTVTLWATACGEDPAANRESTGDVKNPGVVVQAFGIEPTTLDPAAATPSDAVVLIQAYEELLDIPPVGADPVPALATEVPDTRNGGISPDGLVYTFSIREGTKFHDGTDLTAEDVKYSWDRTMTMNIPGSLASNLIDSVASTRVVDDYTFEVTLKQPAAWFLSAVVATPAAAIVSKDAVEAHGGFAPGQINEFMTTNMVGTGSLMFDSWDRNEQLSLKKFPDYWGEAAPNDARYEFVADSAANSLGLLAGDYDIIEPEAGYIKELSGDPGVCITEEGTLVEPILAAFNLNIDPAKLPQGDTIPADFFHDPRVRKAFNYAYNYDQFLEAGLAGYGERATYIPPAMFGYDPDAPRYNYDPKKAEELFRQTGYWDKGFELTVLTEGGHSVFEPAALLLKDNLEALNPKFHINVAALTEAQFDEAFAQQPFPYAMWFKNADGYRDPHFLFKEFHHPDGAWSQRMGFKNGYRDPAAIATLIDKAGSESDRDARFAMYGELQQMIYDDPMWMWLGEEANLQMYRCWLTNFTYNPLWLFPRLGLYEKD